MSSASGSGGGGGGGAAGSTGHQAETLTRNFILGIPKEGLSPDSPEAADLHAAETFMHDIQQEILAYDVANAEAMEAYTRQWWSRVPFLGRGARAAIDQEAAEKAQAQAQPMASSGHDSAHHNDISGAEGFSGAFAGLDPAAAAAAMAAAGGGGGGSFLHTQTGQTTRGGFHVERTSAVDVEQLKGMLGMNNSSTSGEINTVAATSQPRVNSWLFKKKHPGWTPLMQRWWVPWVCVAALGLVWTPDVWKLRALYYSDWQYAILRQSIHRAYWRATMDRDAYDALMADIEAQRPTVVKSTDCPF